MGVGHSDARGGWCVSNLRSPVTNKAMIIGCAVLCFFCLCLTIGYVSVSGELDAEKERHKATVVKLEGKLALADTEISLLRSDQTEQNRVITGLQLQITRSQEALTRERMAAADRMAITAGAGSMPAKKNEVVDAETSRKIIRHLNTALRRP